MMILIVCSGTAGRPCGKALGVHFWQKKHDIYYDHCKACRLTNLVDRGIATAREIEELKKLKEEGEPTMKIQINEVWNAESRSVQLATIEISENDPRTATAAVRDWIAANRPDLTLATSIYAHGYHAVGVQS